VPSKQQHIAKAEGNLSFATSLSLRNPFNIDWALVSLFYAAMHYVEAYLAAVSNIHSSSHRSRDTTMGREPNLREVYKEYQELKFFGYNARYEMQVFEPQDFDRALPRFEEIRARLMKFL
jgi:hypothetical protein